jgi:hypothetical protein
MSRVKRKRSGGAKPSQSERSTAGARFQLALCRKLYEHMERPAPWTSEEQERWRAKLVDFEALDGDLGVAWDWMLPQGRQDWDLLASYMDQVMALASEYTILQKAMERLDGPGSHLPALFWRIVQTMEMERNSPRRGEELQQRKRLLKEARSVRAALSKANASFRSLAISTRDKRDLCVAWLPTDFEPAYDWVDAQIRLLFEANDTLNGCLDTLEKTEHYLWGPVATQTITNPKVDTFSVQQLFYIVKEMVGDRRWKPMYMMMDAMAAIMGFENPFELDSLRESWKSLRGDPRYEIGFQKAVELRRQKFRDAFLNYVANSQADGIFPENEEGSSDL